MQELTMTPSTIVLLLLILAWTVWAVRRLFFRGVCDCHGSDGRHKGGKAASGCASCGSCHGCSACAVATSVEVKQ